jgi:D-tyrosyl-tRNA(Tyr) deacylase
MRLVVQRVNKASVSVKSEVVGKINKGLFVLVGVADGDTKEDAEALAEKLAKLRVMADEKGKMNLSVKDLPAGRHGVGASVLAVSQFTLHADTSKGNRPSFIKAAEPKLAQKIYEHFVNKLKELGVKVQIGSFGDYMTINAELDGPVTLSLESDK